MTAGPFSVTRGGVTLHGEQGGDGPAVVLLHALTATRRYVVMGSRLLERSGHRVIAYDARGHGQSTPAAGPADYAYTQLAGDLEAILDELDLARAVLAGASMGAHTAVAFALAHPQRVAALALITPAYDPSRPQGADALAAWDALAEGLRREGVEGFVRAYDTTSLAPAWRGTLEQVLRQRLSAHLYPSAVADALEGVPRSRPFAEMAQLRAITVPAVVIGSRDEPDPGHPLAVAERYADAIPGARLLVEESGSPLAWQGGRVSRVVAELAARAGETPHGHT